MSQTPRYFYGPVPSRRLGYSLGVDLFPAKTCSFDCIYCQLGVCAHKTIRRLSCVDMHVLRRQLSALLEKTEHIDYITLSGSGEPTLHKNLDEIIRTIKDVSKNRYPVCVITNSSLLYRKKVRDELREADLIIPSLDAARVATFRTLNRPAPGLSLDKIIKGLIALRREYDKAIWLEVMLVAGVNDSPAEARALRRAIERIKPEKVQLNLPVRPSAAKAGIPPLDRIQAIEKILNSVKGVEVVTDFKARHSMKKYPDYAEKSLLKLLSIRPVSEPDLRKISGLSRERLKKLLDRLEKKGTLRTETHGNQKYFTA